MAERLLFNGEARQNRLKNWNGIKSFGGDALPSRNILLSLISQITAEQLREEKKVWRPEETIEAGKIFFTEGKINVVGPPQSGKGTILFGLSEMCDIIGVGYIFISGHHQETTSKEITDTIYEAEKKRIPVFCDSTDYLFLKSRKVGREVSLTVQEEKVSSIIPVIASSSVPIAITSHDEEWAGEFLNLDLRGKYSQYLNQFPKYEIPLHLKSEASILRFLKDHNIDEKITRFILNLPTSIVTVLEEEFGNKKKDEILAATKTYPVLKELARERVDEFHSIIEAVYFEEKKAISLGHLILETNEKCNKLTHIRKAKKMKNNH